MRWLDGITDAMDMNLGTSGDDEGWGAWCPAVRGAKKSQTPLSDSTETMVDSRCVQQKPLHHCKATFFQLEKKAPEVEVAWNVHLAGAEQMRKEVLGKERRARSGPIHCRDVDFC